MTLNGPLPRLLSRQEKQSQSNPKPADPAPTGQPFLDSPMSISRHDLPEVTSIAAKLSKDTTALEVGDVTSEYQKNWEKQILDIIDSHKDYAPKYYVLQIIQKEHGHINLLRNRTFVRKTRPDPDWNTDCYSYDNRSHVLRLEWTLPPKESATMILRNPSQWDPFLVASIQRFLAGSLREQGSQESQLADAPQ